MTDFFVQSLLTAFIPLWKAVQQITKRDVANVIENYTKSFYERNNKKPVMENWSIFTYEAKDARSVMRNWTPHDTRRDMTDFTFSAIL